VRGEELLGPEESSEHVHPSPSALLQRAECSQPPSLTPCFQSHPHRLCELCSVTGASLPSADGGVSFPGSAGISAYVGEGDQAGEGRKCRTALQEYFILGVPGLLFFFFLRTAVKEITEL